MTRSIGTTLTGTWRLVRLALRRDRIVLAVWVAGLTGLLVGVVASVTALYSTAQERAEAAAFSAASSVLRVFDGPAAGPEPGSLAYTEAFGITAVLVALMSAQTVVRHTRQDEETGRAELLGSGVIGRHSRLAAASIVALGTNLVLAAAMVVGLIAVDLPLGGSILAALALAGVGVTFAAVAAVTAQVAELSRGANALAGVAVGTAFLLRGVGDAAGDVADSGLAVVSAWPSWLSPIGWGQQLRPYGESRPWVLVFFVVAATVATVAAVVLTNHRDVGRGMRSVPPGPATASPRLLSPIGLAWRQQRGVLAGWLVAALVLGVAFGIIGEGADELVSSSEEFEAMLSRFGDGSGLVDAYFTFLLRIVAIVAAGYTVQAVLRLRAEEAAGRAEPVLAAAVSRSRWLLSHVAIAAVGTVLVIAVAGVGAGAAYGLVIGDLSGGFADPTAAALVQIPAALTLGAAVSLVFAASPRWAPAFGWGALATSLVVSQFGDVLSLPQAVSNLSPFTHPPLVPSEPVSWTPLLLLVMVGVLVTVASLAVFRRRDLAV